MFLDLNRERYTAVIVKGAYSIEVLKNWNIISITDYNKKTNMPDAFWNISKTLTTNRFCYYQS